MQCVFSATIFPVVQKQHQLLVTLLLCNAASMEVTTKMAIFFNRFSSSLHKFAKCNEYMLNSSMLIK